MKRTRKRTGRGLGLEIIQVRDDGILNPDDSNGKSEKLSDSRYVFLKKSQQDLIVVYRV